MSYVTNSIDDKVVELLKDGGVGFMPSDTVYGLSCEALNEVAVNKLHKIKHRQEGKPFIVLISSVNQLKTLGIDSSELNSSTEKYWPGALTLILPTVSTPQWLTQGLPDLAVRLPNSKPLLDLINEVGPVISTSANKSGESVIETVGEALSQFGENLDFYVDAGKISGQSSTIVRVSDGQFEVLRQGAVKLGN